jgi:8-oxo-dGTP diphosphatase
VRGCAALFGGVAIVAVMPPSDAAIVVGAAIVRGSPPYAEVLAAQRGSPEALAGWWEFPGGKVEHGESELAALRREVAEELGVQIDVGDRVGDDVEVIGGDAVLRVWMARIVSGEPCATEHAALRWLGTDELDDVPWLPPDLPVVAALRPMLAGTVEDSGTAGSGRSG